MHRHQRGGYSVHRIKPKHYTLEILIITLWLTFLKCHTSPILRHDEILIATKDYCRIGYPPVLCTHTISNFPFLHSVPVEEYLYG